MTVIHTNPPLFLRVARVPKGSLSGGQEGDISYDLRYFYIRLHREWKRTAISEFDQVCEDDVPLTGTEGSITYNDKFFYIYSRGKWRKTAISQTDITVSGEEGNVMYDKKYFYIHISGYWRRMAISSII